MNKVAILARPSVKYDIIMLEELWEEKNNDGRGYSCKHQPSKSRDDATPHCSADERGY